MQSHNSCILGTKKATHYTFTDFLNQFRINLKIIATKQSVTEACYESGYANISYFNKIFKKSLVKTPLILGKLITTNNNQLFYKVIKQLLLKFLKLKQKNSTLLLVS
jgi:AraC-like DNA-binding protein